MGDLILIKTSEIAFNKEEDKYNTNSKALPTAGLTFTSILLNIMFHAPMGRFQL
jgi:hypothetical protein